MLCTTRGLNLSTVMHSKHDAGRLCSQIFWRCYGKKSTFCIPVLSLFIFLFSFCSLLTCSFLSGPCLIGFIFNISLIFVGSTWRTFLIAFGRHPLFSPSFGLMSLFLSVLLFSPCCAVIPLSSHFMAVLHRNSKKDGEISVSFIRPGPRWLSQVTVFFFSFTKIHFSCAVQS